MRATRDCCQTKERPIAVIPSAPRTTHKNVQIHCSNRLRSFEYPPEFTALLDCYGVSQAICLLLPAATALSVLGCHPSVRTWVRGRCFGGYLYQVLTRTGRRNVYDVAPDGIRTDSPSRLRPRRPPNSPFLCGLWCGSRYRLNRPILLGCGYVITRDLVGAGRDKVIWSLEDSFARSTVVRPLNSLGAAYLYSGDWSRCPPPPCDPTHRGL